MRLHKTLSIALRLGLILTLAFLTGCATIERPSRDHATATIEAHADDQYPMWSRVTGWLLTPFTGASTGFSF